MIDFALIATATLQFWLGELWKTIVLITDKWQVFEVPKVSLQGSLGQLYLNTERSIAMSEKWPILWKDENFQKNRQQNLIFNGISITTAQQETIQFLVISRNSDGKPTGNHGTLYSITKTSIVAPRGLYGSDRPYIFTSINQGMLNALSLT